VMTARGRVFVAAHRQGRFVEVTRKEGVRYRDARFMPDSQTLLAILYTLDFGMPLEEAMAAPRFHHQALPDVIRLERGGLREETIQALTAMGHAIDPHGGSGTVAAIQKTAGGWVGVIDPRSAGGALGY